MTLKQAYDILELNENASMDEINSAYKAKSQKYHPDIYQGDKAFAEEKMRQIIEAYDLLSMSIDNDDSYCNTSDEPSFIQHLEEMEKELEHDREKLKKWSKKADEKVEKICKYLKKLIRILLGIECILLFTLLVTIIYSTCFIWSRDIALLIIETGNNILPFNLFCLAISITLVVCSIIGVVIIAKMVFKKQK